jgi:DNA mismatch endonuclease (patch repair protein)
MGYRFRLHRKDLPGKPDLVLPRHKKVIFVHGCFWHGHRCKVGGRSRPKSNSSYWNEKLDRNKKRDQANRRKLKRMGWDVLVVWECWTKDEKKLKNRLKSFL